MVSRIRQSSTTLDTHPRATLNDRTNLPARMDMLPDEKSSLPERSSQQQRNYHTFVDEDSSTTTTSSSVGPVSHRYQSPSMKSSLKRL